MVGYVKLYPYYRDHPVLTEEEVGFAIQYAEKRQRASNEPWALRRSALSHHFNPSNTLSTFLLVNPVENSAGHCAVVKFLQDIKRVDQCLEKCHMLGDILIDSILDNWRPYMRYFERRLEDIVSVAQRPLVFLGSST